MTTGAPEALRDEEFFEFIAAPEQRIDPYPFYRRLQSIEPVYRIPAGIWVLTGYDHVSEVLRDGRFSTDERHSTTNQQDGDAELTETPFGKIYTSMLLFRDDPDHKRLRDLVQKGFTRKVVEDLRPRISALVDELLDPVVESGGAELMSGFAYPLPVIVICELLGVPPEDRRLFHDRAREFASRFEIQPLRTPEMEERGDAATVYFADYLDGLIAEKRVRPGNDLISSLVAVEDEDDRLTHDELVATCLLILFAGHETTANLIGNGVFSMMHHRDQWDRLVADPDLARPAVEELLRYDSPVQVVLRVALEDARFGDRTIPKGDPIAVLLAAANRDPNHFTDPERLDITRGGSPIVAFGGGVHFCLGAPLARLEAQIAFSALARRIPGLRIDGDPEWRPSFVIRGLETLPIRTS